MYNQLYEKKYKICLLITQVFAEQALGELPTLSKRPISLEKAMHPGDWSPGAVVLYPVAGDGVVFYELACLTAWRLLPFGA